MRIRAAGVRYADLDGWEAGLAVSRDSLSKDQQAVLEAISGRLGRGDRDKKWQWNADAAIGVFDGPAREGFVDLRLSGNVRRKVGEKINVNVRAGYDGAEFLRSSLQAEEQADEIAQTVNPDAVFDDEILPEDIRREGSDQVDLTASVTYLPKQDFGFLKNPTAGVAGSFSKTGVLKSGIDTAEQTSGSVSVTTGLGNTGINTSASVARSYTSSQIADDPKTDVTSTDFQAQVFKQFPEFTVRARYGKSIRSDSETRESATVTVSRQGFAFGLPKESGVIIGPSLSGVWDGDNLRARGGLNASFNSGEIFGRKNVLNANFGILQSLSSRGDNQSDKFLAISAARRLNIGRKFQFQSKARHQKN